MLTYSVATADPVDPAAATASRRRNPTHRTTGTDLIAALNAEWACLLADPASDTEVARWARSHPVLAGARTLGDVASRAASAHSNEVMAALITAAQAGRRLAGRTLLQLHLGAAVNLALRTRRYAAGDVEEAKARAVACMWEAISAYPLQRRHGSHADGLALDVLQRLTRHADQRRPSTAHRQPELHEVPRSDLLEVLADTPAPAAGTDPALEVLDLLAWAERRAVISSADADLLRRLHTGDRVTSAAELADELGLSPAAIRQRSSRATRRLADAVRRPRVPAVSSAQPAGTSQDRVMRIA